MTDLINKINELKTEREQILKELQEAKINKNDELFIKSLKNKYHCLSNKINYTRDRENIKEQKKAQNKIYMTPEIIQKRREYARKYQKNIKEIIEKYKSSIKEIN